MNQLCYYGTDRDRQQTVSVSPEKIPWCHASRASGVESFARKTDHNRDRNQRSLHCGHGMIIKKAITSEHGPIVRPATNKVAPAEIHDAGS